MKNDLAYNHRDFIPDAEAYPDRWAESARQHREVEAAVGRARLNAAYGTHDREKFDLFHPAGKPIGLLVFLHGGYWRLFDRSYWSHFASGGTGRGWAVAMPSYPLCPEVRISDITRSIASAITKASEFVSGPIALAGHSAGGHLAARMASAGSGLSGPVAQRIVRIAPISPLSDLRPLIETTMNDDLRLDETAAQAESPALLEKTLCIPVDIWVGAEERPAFLNQARWLTEAWSDTSCHVVSKPTPFRRDRCLAGSRQRDDLEPAWLTRDLRKGGNSRWIALPDRGRARAMQQPCNRIGDPGMTTLFIDADACPVKAEAERVATRFRISMVLVCNGGIRPSGNPIVSLVVVDDAPDAADNWIAERCTSGDVVVTADIPLADRCVTAGAQVIQPNGEILHPGNIGQRLATRDLMSEIRSADPFLQGGGSAFSKADRSRFLQSLDKVIMKVVQLE